MITPAHDAHQRRGVIEPGHVAQPDRGRSGNPGETVAGTQGIGVSMPIAAAVAAATIGDMHIPDGMIFTSGT